MTTPKNNYVDTTTEWRLLATIFNDQTYNDWLHRLSPALFTGLRAKVFTAMQEAYATTFDITFEGLRAQLQAEVPGELLTATSGNIHTLVQDLSRLATKRIAKNVGDALVELSNEFNPTLEDIQAAVDFDPILADNDSSLSPGIQTLHIDIERKNSGEYIFARTGLRFLDASFGGEWKPKSLVLYAGAPGTGKTTLAAHSMLKMAEGYETDDGKLIQTPSLLISLEMAKEDVVLKWLGTKLHIDTKDIMSGKVTAQQLRRISETAEYLQDLPMYIIDESSLTLAQIAYEIRKHVFKYGVRVVFIDYLQIANHSPTMNANTDLGDFVKKLRAIAKKLDITVVVLSQITPGKEGVFKVRDSGEVPAHADAIIIGELDKDESGPIKTVNMRREKNRFGPTGNTAVLFNGPYQFFVEGEVE